MKIYTRTGDKGQTGLLGGSRIAKSSHRIQAIGDVDELNAWLGYIRSNKIQSKIEAMLHKIQQDLFCLGAQLANPATVSKSSSKNPLITDNDVMRLEQWIDELESELPTLQHFILPGGEKVGSKLHICRAVCRRAERTVTALLEQENIASTILIFLNRLSDLLFVMARWNNLQAKVEEEEWKG